MLYKSDYTLTIEQLEQAAEQYKKTIYIIINGEWYEFKPEATK